MRYMIFAAFALAVPAHASNVSFLEDKGMCSAVIRDPQGDTRVDYFPQQGGAMISLHNQNVRVIHSQVTVTGQFRNHANSVIYSGEWPAVVMDGDRDTLIMGIDPSTLISFLRADTVTFKINGLPFAHAVTANAHLAFNRLAHCGVH